MADDQAFLGIGWGFPPSFTAGGAEVEMVAGHEDVHQSLLILFATVIGERLMDEGYGCDLHSVQFEEINEGLVNGLSAIVSDAILYHEPRVTLDQVDVSESPAEGGLLLVSIAYTVRSSNSRFNMVYPFYVNEATAPGA
jgi:uncharacterized protein